MNMWLRLALCCLIITQGFAIPMVEAQSPNVFFLPRDGISHITELYQKASRTISIAASVITSAEIANALGKSRGRKVLIRVLIDGSQLRNKFSLHWQLMKVGIDVRVITTMAMSDEFGIVDDRIVYVGSGFLHTDFKQNPKISNYLIFDNSGTAALYAKEFAALFESAAKP